MRAAPRGPQRKARQQAGRQPPVPATENVSGKANRTQLGSEGTGHCVSGRGGGSAACLPACPSSLRPPLARHCLLAWPPWSDPYPWSPREDMVSFGHARRHPLQLFGCVWPPPLRARGQCGAKPVSHSQSFRNLRNWSGHLLGNKAGPGPEHRERCHPQPPKLSRATRHRHTPHSWGTSRRP